MLVLIVVAAAVAFSLFVASYQKQVQSEESLQQQKNLESLRIVSLVPALANPSDTTWSGLNFTVGSEYVNPSVITGLDINGNVVRTYNATITGQSGWKTYFPQQNTTAGNLVLPPHAQTNINITFNPLNPFFGMYSSSFTLPTTSYIRIDVFTLLLNDFNQVFVPPTAIAVVTTIQTWNGSAYVTLPVLDGSQSFQPGNGTVVAWNWNVTNETSGAHTLYFGQKVVCAVCTAPGTTYSAVLTVTNSNYLFALTSVTYKVPS